MAKIVMAYIVMANIVMAKIATANSYGLRQLDSGTQRSWSLHFVNTASIAEVKLKIRMQVGSASKA